MYKYYLYTLLSIFSANCFIIKKFCAFIFIQRLYRILSIFICKSSKNAMKKNWDYNVGGVINTSRKKIYASNIKLKIKRELFNFDFSRNNFLIDF